MTRAYATSCRRSVRARRLRRVPFVRTAVGRRPPVTVYVSTDRVFSEPILREYEKQSGVKVNAVYDTEETKSTGLANRLLAEKARPQADVFWSNEPVRTLVLKSRDVLAPYRSPSAKGIPDGAHRPRRLLDGLLGAHTRHRVQHQVGDARTMPRNRSSTWPIRSGRGRSRWPIPGLARRRFTSRRCMPSPGTRRWTSSSAG